MSFPGLSPESFVALLLAGGFAVLCYRDAPRAILVFTGLAWIPFVRVMSLPGSTIAQDLLLVELLATVLIGVWWLKRVGTPRAPVMRATFEVPLFLMIPASLVSLVVSLGGHDPAVDERHIKLAVSLGQVLLIVWPIGLYVVVARTITTTHQIRSIFRLITAMAVPSVLLPVVPQEYLPLVSWSLYPALVVSPFCLAASFNVSAPLKKVGLWVLALSPLVYGITIGKAFFYVTTSLALLTVVMLNGRRLLIALIPLCAGVYLIAATASGSFVPEPVAALIDVERQQQSWGGRAGRLAIGADAISIWAKYPLFGVGPGNSWPYMNRYSVIDTPHNQYLNLLLELGMVGLACFLWYISAAVRFGLRVLGRFRDDFHRAVAVGWLGFFSGTIVSGLTGDFILHSIRNDGLALFSGYYFQWIVLGLVVAAERIEGDRL